MHCCFPLHCDYPGVSTQEHKMYKMAMIRMSPDMEQGIMLKLYIS